MFYSETSTSNTIYCILAPSVTFQSTGEWKRLLKLTVLKCHFQTNNRYKQCSYHSESQAGKRRGNEPMSERRSRTETSAVFIGDNKILVQRTC